ncbi:MAG: lysophospholipid acyltransferase family protein [Planctomycetota bacterium]|nr:lysophospholipid acyltransferase family protein [Planctomycetota bacterium]
MFAKFFTNDPPRSLYRRCFYRFWQWFWQMVLLVMYKVRVHHQHRLPRSGATLLCSNHQSNLDPIVIGCVSPRRLNFLAKKGLFHFPLGVILRLLDAIPIDRDGIGIGGMKETLRRLKKKEPVLIFPEGERSWDGEILPLMKGFTALVKRVPVTLVPIGLDGPFDAWPRGARFPRPGQIQVVIGQPIQTNEIDGLSDEQISELLFERIQQCLREARSHYQHVG